MANVLQSLSSYSSYRDSRSPLSIAVQHANLALSSTVYVGNLSFFTTEEQIYELFSRAGEVSTLDWTELSSEMRPARGMLTQDGWLGIAGEADHHGIG